MASRVIRTNMNNCHNSLEERLAEQDDYSFRAGIMAVGERIEHCDEIRDPDKDEALIYYGVKPSFVEALKQGRMPE